MQTHPGWVLLPENRAAHQAVERVRECVGSAGPRRAINPLFVHGPAGTGKTRLLRGLIDDVLRCRADLPVAVLAAADLARPGADDDMTAARSAGLVVVEDVQHLPQRAAEVLSALVDHCVARQIQLIVSATAGPARLALPARLASRLAGGLVVALEAFAPASRREFLRRLADRRGLPVEPGVLDWLADNTPGSARQLEGALTRLADLSRALGRAATPDEVAAAFGEDAEAHRPTVERIAQHVGRHFRIEPDRLRSRGRTREVLLPRQIGAYFGGRDHSTVLHACRKVEQALARDAGLSGTVRQLHADLS
jgi:chromosomal replication initiator protein